MHLVEKKSGATYLTQQMANAKEHACRRVRHALRYVACQDLTIILLLYQRSVSSLWLECRYWCGARVNVSASAAVLLSEAVRQRGLSGMQKSGPNES